MHYIHVYYIIIHYIHANYVIMHDIYVYYIIRHYINYMFICQIPTNVRAFHVRTEVNVMMALMGTHALVLQVLLEHSVK